MATPSESTSGLEALRIDVAKWSILIPMVLLGLFLFLNAIFAVLFISLLVLEANGDIAPIENFDGRFLIPSLLSLALWVLAFRWLLNSYRKGLGYVELTSTHLTMHYRKIFQKMPWENLSEFHIGRTDK